LFSGKWGVVVLKGYVPITMRKDSAKANVLIGYALAVPSFRLPRN